LRHRTRIYISAAVLIICAMFLNGCATIPIPTRIPIPNEIPLIGGAVFAI
jgi:hypothetical protein